MAKEDHVAPHFDNLELHYTRSAKFDKIKDLANTQLIMWFVYVFMG